MSQTCGLVATAGIGTLGCINKSIMCRIKEVITLCYSALGRPHRMPSVQLGAPDFKKAYPEKRDENSERTGKFQKKRVYHQRIITGLMGKRKL